MLSWVRLWALALLVATAAGFAVPVGPAAALVAVEAPAEGLEGESSAETEGSPEWAPRRRAGVVGWAVTAPATTQPLATPRADYRARRPALTHAPLNRLALLQRLNC